MRPHFHEELKSFAWWSKLFGRCTVSCIFVLLAQLALVSIPLFFPSSALVLQLLLSALVLILVIGFERWVRRFLGISGSAPAFVIFNIIFLWGVYLGIIRKAVSGLVDFLFNVEVIWLLIGLFSIMFKDPGFAEPDSNCSDKLVGNSGFPEHESRCSDKLVESSGFGVQDKSYISVKRVRYCKTCKAYVKGFDHHCPAFGNCIGQNNYLLFLVLLVGFLATEASYVFCSSKFATEWQIIYKINHLILMVRSTMLFSLLQVLWQVVFLIWHIHCVCLNITTDEWINWKKYPEFQLPAESQLGEESAEMRFRNPYDKGILQNVKRVLTSKR